MSEESALDYKNQGNSFLKQKELIKARDSYTKGLNLPQDDKELTFFLYSNRSYANLLVNSNADALYDANKAIETNPDHFKGYLRKSNVLSDMSENEEAIKEITKAIKLNKEEQSLKLQLEILQKRKNQFQFPADGFSPCLELILNDENIKYDVALTFAKAFIFDSCNQMNVESWNIVVNKINEIYKEKAQTIRINVPKLTILGDIRGNIGKLLEFFEKYGYPKKDNAYLINGNFAINADHRIFLVLFLFKLADPDSIFLNRGYMDTDRFLEEYGFVKRVKYYLEDNEIAQKIADTIKLFPICHIVNDKFAVFNGGPPLQQFDNTVDPVWGCYSHINKGFLTFENISMFSFGSDIVDQFLKETNCQCVIRSQSPCQDGYEVLCDGKIINVFFHSNISGKTNKSGHVVISGDQYELCNSFNEPLFPLSVHYCSDSVAKNKEEVTKYFTGLFYRMRLYLNGENPAKSGIFEMMASQPRKEEIVPVEMVVDSSCKLFDYMTTPIPGSFIIFNFAKRKIILEHYSIESARLQPGNDHMKTWMMQGSENAKDWVIIDKRENEVDLNGPMQAKVFEVQVKKPFTFLRLIQHERNHRGNWNLCLYHIELFGTIE